MKNIKNYEKTRITLNIAKKRLQSIDDEIEVLNREKEDIKQLISKTYNIISEMEKDLKTLSGYEYKLYYEMVVNETNVNKAIEKIATYNNISTSSLWKSVYPKIKNKIKEIKDI